MPIDFGHKRRKKLRRCSLFWVNLFRPGNSLGTLGCNIFSFHQIFVTSFKEQFYKSWKDLKFYIKIPKELEVGSLANTALKKTLVKLSWTLKLSQGVLGVAAQVQKKEKTCQTLAQTNARYSTKTIRHLFWLTANANRIFLENRKKKFICYNEHIFIQATANHQAKPKH